MSKISMHGSMLKIHELGVLLIGAPGIGKSQLALELLDRGHQLIGDDYIEAEKINDKIIVSSSHLSQRFIWTRYLGIINVEKIFGDHSIINMQELHLIIHLLPAEQLVLSDDPLTPHRHFHDIAGISITEINLPAQASRLPLLVDILCKNQKLANGNYVASHEFRKTTVTDANAQNHKNS